MLTSGEFEQQYRQKLLRVAFLWELRVVLLHPETVDWTVVGSLECPGVPIVPNLLNLHQQVETLWYEYFNITVENHHVQ